MLNTIRMDLYRLFKSKSFYVTLLIAVFCMVISVATLKIDMSSIDEKVQQASEEENMLENVGIQMGYMGNMKGEDITVGQALQIQIGTCTILLMGVIFCVIFITGDHSSGYIKNVIGRKNYRNQTSISKAITMAVYTVIELASCLVAIILSLLCFFQKVNIGSVEEILRFLGVQFLIELGLLTLCILVCNLLRNIGIAMAFAICLSSGLFSLITQLIDRIDLPFKTSDYLLSTLTRTLPLQYDSTIYIRSIITPIICMCVYLLGSTIVMKRQDIK